MNRMQQAVADDVRAEVVEFQQLTTGLGASVEHVAIVAVALLNWLSHGQRFDPKIVLTVLQTHDREATAEDARQVIADLNEIRLNDHLRRRIRSSVLAHQTL